MKDRGYTIIEEEIAYITKRNILKGDFMMIFNRKQRFSIRKLSIGAASVLVGFCLAGQVVSADEVQAAPTSLVATTGPAVASAGEGGQEVAPV